jgi:hypothetical protein
MKEASVKIDFAFHSPPQLHHQNSKKQETSVATPQRKSSRTKLSRKRNIFSHLLNRLDLFCLRGCDFDPTLQSQKIHLKLLANTPSPYGLDRILDLPSIHLPLRQFLHVFLRNPRLGSVLRETRQKFLPEKKTRGKWKRCKEEVDIDSGAEGCVNGGVEVGGQEDDSFEVFEFSEEDWKLLMWLEEWKWGRSYWKRVRYEQCHLGHARP